VSATTRVSGWEHGQADQGKARDRGGMSCWLERALCFCVFVCFWPAGKGGTHAEVGRAGPVVLADTVGVWDGEPQSARELICNLKGIDGLTGTAGIRQEKAEPSRTHCHVIRSILR
jgi:hypothetical protein